MIRENVVFCVDCPEPSQGESIRISILRNINIAYFRMGDSIIQMDPSKAVSFMSVGCNLENFNLFDLQIL
jgi:hypothetical protein